MFRGVHTAYLLYNNLVVRPLTQKGGSLFWWTLNFLWYFSFNYSHYSLDPMYGIQLQANSIQRQALAQSGMLLRRGLSMGLDKWQGGATPINPATTLPPLKCLDPWGTLSLCKPCIPIFPCWFEEKMCGLYVIKYCVTQFAFFSLCTENVALSARRATCWKRHHFLEGHWEPGMVRDWKARILRVWKEAGLSPPHSRSHTWAGFWGYIQRPDKAVAVLNKHLPGGQFVTSGFYPPFLTLGLQTHLASLRTIS